MKNKLYKRNDDYRHVRTKIFVRTVIMAAVAVISILALYSFVLHGYFANWVIALCHNVFRMDYDAAFNLYQQTFRNYAGVIFIAAMAAVFLLIFHIYLRLFTKYFIEINRGMDALIKEGTEDVILSPELAATEKKINTIKHNLEKRKLDAQLAEQRKNELVVYLAHDLKTPLSSVIGYLTLLRDEGQISEQLRKKYLSISLDKAERLEDLINEFFEITRLNLSSIELQYSSVNLTRMLEQLTFEFQPMLLEKNLQCVLNVASDITVKCDINKIQRVFDNLLRNAVFYSFENSSIEVSAYQNDTKVSISFINRGNTISDEKLGHIFEQFYRLDTSRSSNSGGAGLGLAIAKEIITLHHGRITAASENEKIEFCVSLPVS